MPAFGRTGVLRRSLLRACVIALCAAGTASYGQNEASVDSITIKVGEKIHVTFTEDGSRLIKPVVSSSPPSEGASISVELVKMGMQRTLTVTNGYLKPISCRARFKVFRRTERLERELGPVAGEQDSMMSFPDPIEEIEFFDFRLQEG